MTNHDLLRLMMRLYGVAFLVSILAEELPFWAHASTTGVFLDPMDHFVVGVSFVITLGILAGILWAPGAFLRSALPKERPLGGDAGAYLAWFAPFIAMVGLHYFMQNVRHAVHILIAHAFSAEEFAALLPPLWGSFLWLAIHVAIAGLLILCAEPLAGVLLGRVRPRSDEAAA